MMHYILYGTGMAGDSGLVGIVGLDLVLDIVCWFDGLVG